MYWPLLIFILIFWYESRKISFWERWDQHYEHPEHLFAKLWFMHQANSNLFTSSLFSFLNSWIKQQLKQPTMYWLVTCGALWIECCRRKCDKWVISTALNHSITHAICVLQLSCEKVIFIVQILLHLVLFLIHCLDLQPSHFEWREPSAADMVTSERFPFY